MHCVISMDIKYFTITRIQTYMLHVNTLLTKRVWNKIPMLLLIKVRTIFCYVWINCYFWSYNISHCFQLFKAWLTSNLRKWQFHIHFYPVCDNILWRWTNHLTYRWDIFTDLTLFIILYNNFLWKQKEPLSPQAFREDCCVIRIRNQ